LSRDRRYRLLPSCYAIIAPTISSRDLGSGERDTASPHAGNQLKRAVADCEFCSRGHF
jgi:hypothetical protein